MRNTIRQYIRNKQGHPRGVLIARQEGNSIYVGFSFCNKADPFDKKIGVALAFERAQRTPTTLKGVVTPREVLHKLPEFKKRAEKYFKGAFCVD